MTCTHSRRRPLPSSNVCWNVDFARRRRLSFAGWFWTGYLLLVPLVLLLLHLWGFLGEFGQ